MSERLGPRRAVLAVVLAGALVTSSDGRDGGSSPRADPRGHQRSSGRGALEPVRVYVGLRSADTPEVRAKLGLEELNPQTPNMQRVMDFAYDWTHGSGGNVAILASVRSPRGTTRS
jgi:hypothetical protein